jgi:hypothetical protein
MKNETLWKIKEMYFSDDIESRSIGIGWLHQLIGEKDALANLFVLMFYRDWDDDSDMIIDEDNFCKMKFNTYPISFGKDYRYRVCRVAKFNGVELLNDDQEYSRWQVGNGEPKWDFCDRICQELRKQGITFYDGLFAKKANHEV